MKKLLSIALLGLSVGAIARPLTVSEMQFLKNQQTMPAHASFLPENYPTGEFCYVEAGRDYDIDPYLLKAIAILESNEFKYAFNMKGKELTAGLYQFSEKWEKELNKQGVEFKQLFDPCVSIYFAAYKLNEFRHQNPNNLEFLQKFSSEPNFVLKVKETINQLENEYEMQWKKLEEQNQPNPTKN